MKVLFVSLGCDKNLVDSENMLGLLRERGYDFTDDEEDADVIVINSCCFINDAKEESINTIIRLGELRTDPAKKCRALIVTGCLAQRYADEIREEMPEADACIGTTAYDRIVSVLDRVFKGEYVRELDDKEIRIQDEMSSFSDNCWCTSSMESGASEIVIHFMFDEENNFEE